MTGDSLYDEFDIVIDNMDDFNDLIQGDDCVLSKMIVEHLESLQRRGLSRCKPEDFIITIHVIELEQNIILTIDSNNLDEVLDLNLKRLEENEHYRYCARLVGLRKRIEASRRRQDKKLLQEILNS